MTRKTNWALTEEKIMELVEQGAKLTSRKDSIEEELREIRAKLVAQGRLVSKNGEAVAFEAEKSRAVVSFGERISWDALRLTGVRDRLGSMFEKLFKTRISYESEPGLAEFLEEKTEEFKETREEIQKAMTVKAQSPTVKFYLK